MPNVLSPRDLVSRPDNMDETVLHNYCQNVMMCLILLQSEKQYEVMFRPYQDSKVQYD